MVDVFLPIRPNDIADVILVTILVYAAMVWVRRNQSGFVAIGILIIAALYVLATALDLRLTAWIFQGFFAIFLVIIVVIFQEELRQLFERLAIWSLRRSTLAASTSGPTDVLTKCLADFARDRIGALVVFPGNQPISRHIQGGIELGGRISEPLVKSLFDPHSPGHDGAVVIEGDRVARFAAHLPLSRAFQQLAGKGTRHSAALGLAELTDALCLVVSEERGQISVARDGRLRQLGDMHVVADELRGFLDEKHRPQNGRRAAWRLLRDNWVEKVVSLALVAAFWSLFVGGSRPATHTYAVPVTVANLPAALVLDSVDPSEVEISLSGPSREFYLFDRAQLQVTIDATLAVLGRRTFDVEESDVTFPRGVMLENVRPPKVKISVTERQRVE